MDGLPSSTAHTLSKELHTVKPYITILVLVTGVVGGLVIVISVILFCKYCIKHNKILRRQPAIFSRSLSTAGQGRRKYQVYESLDLTATSDVCASSQDFKSRNLYSDCSDDALRHDADEENNIDYAVRKYKESLHVQDEVISRSSTTVHGSCELGLADLPQTEDKSADYRGFLQPPVTSDAAGRFTDGDFQNLKLLRMDRPQRMIKQKTYSGPSLDQAGRDQRRQSVASLRRAFTEVQNKEVLSATESDMYGEASSSPRAALKLSGFLDSSGSMPPRGGVALTKGVFKDSPPMALKPYRTEVSVEVHREAGNVGSGQQKEMTKVSLSHRASPPHSYSTVSSSSSRLSGRDKSWDRDRDRDRERDRDRDRDRSLQRPRVESPQRLLAKPTRHAHSLETVSPTDRLSIKYDQRRVKSYDGELLDNTRNHRSHDPGDYDRLEITQFNQGPFYNADYDVMCEGRSPEPRSKVRYNDTGSFEEITDEDVQLLDDLDPMDESDDTETLNGTQKYRELWTLRATFEEEEDFSDTIRMEDMTSPEEQSAEEQEPVLTSVTTSFESSTDPAAEPVINHHHHQQHYHRLSGHALNEHDVKPGSANLLHPNYESRRETYRSILSKRLKRIEAPNSTDNSFDSVETLDTDGDVSDTSRPEQTTTSFESTTDNTDSTGERETHRLQQMRGDSGYKSLEAQQTLPQPLSPKRLTAAGGSTDQQEPQEDKHLLMPNPSPEDLQQVAGGSGVNHDRECANISIPVPQSIPQQTMTPRRGTHLDRRSVRTASKKRREYSRERQAVHVSESAAGEAETDSRSDHMSGDSFDDSHVRSGKFSVFSRFFRSQCHKRGAVARDYSIDEKTNAIFHEFVRHDPYLDTTRSGGCTGFLLASGSRGAHPYTRHRSLHHRKSTDPTLSTDHRRRNKLTPEMRSVSLGSDSSTSSVRRLSPQDSIEEEDYEQLSPIIREQIQFSRLWSECKLADRRVSGSGGGQNGSDRWSLETSVHSSSTIKEIPIIKLPEDDSETPH